MSDQQPTEVVIVGAGIAGLYQLHRLREAGISARVIEAGDGVGGTWYWNRYPGARCDVESMAYSYSFSPELEQEWTWTEKYPTQPEILKYVEHVAERFDLKRDVTFNTRVTAASWDEDGGQWNIELDNAETIQAKYLITAVGCLSTKKAPEIPGADTFAGPIYHTGSWPKEGVDLTGKTVGVIGTGSSGIQSIPVMAQQAKQMTVFQRTPNFSMPAGNRPLTEAEIETMKNAYRDFRHAQKVSTFGVPVEPATESALEVPAAEREARYQAGWDKGDLVAILAAYKDTLTDKEANDTAAEFIRSKIRSIVKDPDLAETLSPRSFPFGTKRPCLDTGYFHTFNEDHVSLVDLRKTPLVEITPTGIKTTEQEYEFDVIVFATGFDAMTGSLLAMNIRGRDGISLRDEWQYGPRTYLGLGMSGFPNLFTITGPGSPSVLSNMIVSIEQHADWITDCLQYMREHQIGEIEPTARAQDEWVEQVAELGNTTLFPTADSWYMGSNVPGKPRVFTPYVGGVGLYRERCDEVAANGYEGYALTPAKATV